MTQGLRKLVQRPESISAQVYEVIRDAIVDKTLPPGQPVTEVGLARELAVSKTPVRDALLRLREQRLILGDSQQGLRVVYATREAIAHAYETRSALEAAAASAAAARATPAHLEELDDAAARSLASAEASSDSDFRSWDETFHNVIAAAAANPYLASLAGNAYLLTRVLRARDVRMPGGESVKCAQEHIDIARAVRGGAGELAGELAASHVAHVMTGVLAAFPVAGASSRRLDSR